jgi:hypothetical protein
LKITLSILTLMNITQKRLDIPNFEVSEHWTEKLYPQLYHWWILHCKFLILMNWHQWILKKVYCMKSIGNVLLLSILKAMTRCDSIYLKH